MRYFNDYIRSPAQTQDSIRKSLNRVDITKKDEEKQYVFGWAKIAVDENGNQLVDRQNDLIDTEELEQTAYTYVEFYREAGEMHERGGVLHNTSTLCIGLRSMKNLVSEEELQ